MKYSPTQGKVKCDEVSVIFMFVISIRSGVLCSLEICGCFGDGQTSTGLTVTCLIRQVTVSVTVPVTAAYVLTVRYGTATDPLILHSVIIRLFCLMKQRHLTRKADLIGLWQPPMEQSTADPLAEVITTYNELNSPIIEELDGEPSPLEFMRYVSRNTPFVVRKAAATWSATKMWNAQYLEDSLRDQTVNVAVTPKGFVNHLFQIFSRCKFCHQTCIVHSSFFHVLLLIAIPFGQKCRFSHKA